METLKELNARLVAVESKSHAAKTALDEAAVERSEVLKAISVAIAPAKKITLRAANGEVASFTICVRAKSGLYYLKGQNDTPSVDLDA